jgi:Flp pilus assembly protein TadG
MANIGPLAAIFQKLGVLRANARGTAAIEFGVTGLMLVIGLLNAVDVGFYVYKRMEVENSAEAGAQAAWKTCGDAKLKGYKTLPATQNCTVANGADTDLNSAIDSAIQSTSLGTYVSRYSGYPTEGYYCVNASSVLQLVGPVTSAPPANCSAAGDPAVAPGDYLQVQVTYPYQPLFSGLSVMSALGISSITPNPTWMRLG